MDFLGNYFRMACQKGAVSFLTCHDITLVKNDQFYNYPNKYTKKYFRGCQICFELIIKELFRIYSKRDIFTCSILVPKYDFNRLFI